MRIDWLGCRKLSVRNIFDPAKPGDALREAERGHREQRHMLDLFLRDSFRQSLSRMRMHRAF